MRCRFPPSTDAAVTQTTGNWPNGVNRRRWAQTVPGMDGKGVVFARHHGGAFRRYEPQTTPVR